MRTFLSMTNLLKAMGMSAVVTAMSVPWIVLRGLWPGLLIPSLFVLMTFVCGFVTAWGNSAGMPGIVTDRQTLLRGVTVATALLLAAFVIQVFWMDPVLYKAFLSSAKPSAVGVAFPAAFGDRMAGILWATGFQAMFLVAAPMSFFARLCRRQHLAVGFCLVFRAYVAQCLVTEHGVSDGVGLLLASTLIAAAAGCILFARFGLAPAILFSAGTSLHVFVSPVHPD